MDQYKKIVAERVDARHIEILHWEWGFSYQTIAENEIHSARNPHMTAREFGYKPYQFYDSNGFELPIQYPNWVKGGIIFPLYELLGNDEKGYDFARMRPDKPKMYKNVKTGKCKPGKYVQPRGVPCDAFIPYRSRQRLRAGDDSPVYIVDGEKKALILEQGGMIAASIAGVDCWRVKGTKELVRNLRQIDWTGRTAYIVLDYDVKEKTRKNVLRAAKQLAAALLKAGAKEVRFVKLPPADDGSKQGADDFILDKGNFYDLPRRRNLAKGYEAFQQLVAEAEPYYDVEGEREKAWDRIRERIKRRQQKPAPKKELCGLMVMRCRTRKVLKNGKRGYALFCPRCKSNDCQHCWEMKVQHLLETIAKLTLDGRWDEDLYTVDLSMAEWKKYRDRMRKKHEDWGYARISLGDGMVRVISNKASKESRPVSRAVACELTAEAIDNIVPKRYEHTFCLGGIWKPKEKEKVWEVDGETKRCWSFDTPIATLIAEGVEFRTGSSRRNWRYLVWEAEDGAVGEQLLDRVLPLFSSLDKLYSTAEQREKWNPDSWDACLDRIYGAQAA